MYKVNDVVVHENGGVYRIVSIGKPDFVKGQEEYYTMKSVWDDSSMIYVKINNDKVYMRPVISKAEARSYLEKLSGIDAEYDTNNKEREKKNRQILKSCEVSQYLELMKAILLEQEKKKQGGKKLNCSDEKDLQRAEKMLISELAVVFNVTVESARKSVVEAVFTQDKDGTRPCRQVRMYLWKKREFVGRHIFL